MKMTFCNDSVDEADRTAGDGGFDGLDQSVSEVFGMVGAAILLKS
jgi:hypothetical protein